MSGAKIAARQAIELEPFHADFGQLAGDRHALLRKTSLRYFP